MSIATMRRMECSSSMHSYVEPEVDSPSVISSTLLDSQVSYQGAWERLIESTLLEWLHDPTLIEDEDLEAPTATTIRLSLDLAEQFKEKNFPAPNCIVPDANGGIVFERTEGATTESLHIWSDNSIEYMQFNESALVHRCPVQL